MLRQTRHIISIALIAIAQILVGQERRDAVTFSQQGGFYDESFELMLMCSSENHIRYTTDGNNPTATSQLYEAPLWLDENLYSDANIFKIQVSPQSLSYIPNSVRHAIVIRAAVFNKNDICISETTTNTYFINSLGFDGNGFAIMSVCADSLSLFDYETGIFVPGASWSPSDSLHTGNYYQTGKEWERLANVEFYEPNDNTGINQLCGLRTHGNLSRRYPAKGMKIYAREEYGNKRFKHKFFPNSNLKSFKHLVLKPFAVFWPYSGVQDYFCTTLAQQLDIDSPQCRPVLMFLNGEYWGIYFVQEKTDERFLEDHHGIDPDNCNIIGSWHGEAECGSNASFLQMMNWFENADLSDNAAYEQACSMIDINNFIDYYVFETFVGNWDWPGNNMRCWQDGDSRWRWIFFDGDATIIQPDYDVFANAAIYRPPTTWSNFPETKLIFGKLLSNDQFINSFMDRARELCNGPFLYENTFPIFNDIVETLRPKINDQRQRFGYPTYFSTWENGNNSINDFLRNRVDQYLAMTEVLQTLENHTRNLFCCYPNPANGPFNIEIYGIDTKQAHVDIFNVIGQKVYTKDLILQNGINSIPIQLDLGTGVYFVRIGNETTKIIIK